MVYEFKKSEPRWINFENPNGEKGRGGTANNGAKGHAFEKLLVGENKVLCDYFHCEDVTLLVHSSEELDFSKY